MSEEPGVMHIESATGSLSKSYKGCCRLAVQMMVGRHT
jgi:hypothetical protein